jgi:hypothetical protein
MTKYLIILSLLIFHVAHASEPLHAYPYEETEESQAIEIVGPEEDWDYENKTKVVRQPRIEPMLLCGTIGPEEEQE